MSSFFLNVEEDGHMLVFKEHEGMLKVEVGEVGN